MRKLALSRSASALTLSAERVRRNGESEDYDGERLWKPSLPQILLFGWAELLHELLEKIAPRSVEIGKAHRKLAGRFVRVPHHLSLN